MWTIRLNNLFNFKSLRSKLLLYLLIFSIIPLLLLGTIAAFWIISTLNENTESFSDKLLKNNLDYVNYVIKQVENYFAIVSKSEIVRNVSTNPNGEQEIRKLFDYYLQSDNGINNLYLGTIDGKLYSRLSLDTPQGDITKHDWYIKGFGQKTGEFVWTEPHKSIFNNSNVITVSKYIINLDGTPAGVLACDVDLHQVSKILSRVDLGQKGFTILLDKHNKIIGGPDQYLDQIYDNEFQKHINSRGNNLFKEAKYDQFDWKIVGVISKRDVENSGNTILWVLVALILICIIMGIFFSITYNRYVVKPIEVLKDLMNEGATGDLDILFNNTLIKNNKIQEIDEMASTFNKMIFTLKVLKQSLEQKILQKTQLAEELREVNEELNAQQEELIQLNEILGKSNHELENANLELRVMQTKLVQSEKMASLGNLVAGIAHEINTPLGAIHCNIDLYKTILHRLKAMDAIIQDEQANAMISKLEMANSTNFIASERIVEIVKALRNFARLDEAEYKDANIHDGIDSTLLILQSQIKNKIEIIKEFGEVSRINCYPNQLNQVFLNLFVNAIHAIKERGKIWIKTYLEGDKVYVKVSDNGTGIKPEHIGKVFDPGFTTKGVGVGTGLGLSIVYNIIEKHGGRIWVESKWGEGTDFTIELPINNQANK